MFKILILFLISPILLTVNFAYSKPSVFPIYNNKVKAKAFYSVFSYIGRATAFYIGEGKFVTNFHVVNTDNQYNSYSIDSLGSNKLKAYAKIIHLDAKNDLAVLKVNPNYMKILEENITPLTLSEAPNLIKNSKYKIVVIDYHHYDEETRVQHDIKSNHFNQGSEGSRMQFVSNKIKNGMSGSPILDTENQVIGILCNGHNTRGTATPVAKLLALLKTQQLECESNIECIKQEIKNLKKQANNGDAVAQNELARKYASGKDGVPQDFKQAAYWFKKAAEQGNSDAQTTLGKMYQYGDRGISKDFKKSTYWYKKAAEQGNSSAQSSLGYMYYQGKGVSKDLKQAVYWFKKSAEQGDSYAQNSLGYMYQNGDGVPQDLTKAMNLYKQAAEQGDSYAQDSLGYMYQYGNGIPKDLTKAAAWYKLAAAQGNERAQKALQKIKNKFRKTKRVVEKLLKTIPAAL